MDDQKIKKEIEKVSIFLSDGTIIDGTVFLNLYGANHFGPQNFGDLLNAGERFIPVKTEGKILLLNVHQIVQARIGSERETNDLMKMGSAHSISVKLAVGGEIEGEIFISVRQGVGRVNDYVNQPIAFFRLFQSEHIIYINQRFIIEIHDKPTSPATSF